MFEFLWVLILIATLVGFSSYRVTGDRWLERLCRHLAVAWRWWLALTVLLVVGMAYLWNNVMRTALNILLFFERHDVLIAILLVIALGGFILAWRCKLPLRGRIGGGIFAVAVTALLVYKWYCLAISLLLLILFGLVLIQGGRLRWPGWFRWIRWDWVCVSLTTFLAAGLILSRVLY